MFFAVNLYVKWIVSDQTFEIKLLINENNIKEY